MKQSLEEYLNSQKTQFEEDIFNSSHTEIFANKLSAIKRKKKQLKLMYVSIAASFAILLIPMSYFFFSQNNVQPTTADSFYVNELMEVEYYYASNEQEALNQLDTLNLNETEKLMINQEIASMDSIKNSILTDYKNSNGDERVTEALINHYETKQRVIQKIINTIKLKNQNYEKVDI